MSDTATETKVETPAVETEVKQVKPLTDYPQMLIEGVGIVNNIATEHNKRVTDLRKSTGSEDERIQAAADSSTNPEILRKRERIQKAKDLVESLENEIKELAKAEVTDILTPEQIESEQKVIATLRKDWNDLFTGSFGMFKIMCKLTDEEMESVKTDHVLALVSNGRKSHTTKSGTVSGDGATRKRIKSASITVDGETSTVLGNDGKPESVTIGNVVARLKNHDIQLSSTEFTKQVTAKYDKGNGWDDVPNSGALLSIPAATTENSERVIQVVFDKK